MRKLNKVLAVVLALAMVFSLVACGNKDDGGKKENTTTKATSAAENADDAGDDEPAASDDPYQAAIDARKAEAEKTGVYPVVKHAIFTWTGQPDGMERVQEAMNVILREKLGLEVELIMMDYAAYRQDVRLMITGGEDIDWFMGSALGYASLVNDGYLYDLEEDDLINTYGPGIKDMIRQEYLDACRFGGQLFGLPPMKDYAIESACFMIGKEFLDGIGYEYEEVNGEVRSSWDEVEDIFTQLHEKYPEKTVLAIIDNLISQGSIIDGIGGDWYGVLLHPDKSLEVENLFTSDEYKELCTRMYNWNQKGFIAADALTDTTAASARIKSGQYMAHMSQSKPGYKVQQFAECGKEMVLFVAGDDVIKSTGCNNTLCTLNQACEDPIAAMQYMNEMYTNPDLANLIVWGEEGVDYQLMDDGHITFADGVNADNATWFHSMNWELPNQYNAHVWEGDLLNLGEATMNFNDGALKSLALGFTFDNSELADTYTALQNVYDQYNKTLVMGFADPETAIPEFQAALEKAGLNEYIEAKKAALEAWKAANGK